MNYEDKTKEIIAQELKAKVISIKQTSGGYSHHMREVEIDKPPYHVFVRFSNISEKKERDLRKEIFVLEKFREVDAPVPQILAFKKNNGKEEHDYMIISKLSGTRLDTIWDSISQEEKIQISEEIGKLMKKLHTIKLEKFGTLEENGYIEGDDAFKFKQGGEQKKYSMFLRILLKDVFKEMARLTSYDHINPERIMKYLKFILKYKEMLDYQGPPVLIHGDMVHRHIFVEKKNGQYEITGVIDIEFAEPSCPEYDFIKLHRTGFFDDSQILQALKRGYGPIDEKKVLFYRITRDLMFAQVLIESGCNEQGGLCVKSQSFNLE